MSRPAHLDRFNMFRNEYTPLVNASMDDFFSRRIDEATLPVIREMYTLLKEYCRREGKRVRPLILLMSYFGYGGARSDDVIRMSSVLEMMHSFLLIQDDIIDRSVLRRGGKSLHLVCGEKYDGLTHNKNIGMDISLILADILVMDSLAVVAEAGVDDVIKNRFMRIFADAYWKTAWGQILDTLHSHPRSIERPEETVRRIALMKTAYYTVVSPMLMGYVLTGGDSPDEKRLIEQFSVPLGLAFQNRDDYLGMFGEEDDTGKPSDSDIVEGKATFLISGALRILEGGERRRFMRTATKKKKGGRDIERIRKMIRTSGSIGLVADLHRGLVDESSAVLPELGLADEFKAIARGLIELVSTL
jgi:geranylgeranyl diphosphate synthase type I